MSKAASYYRKLFSSSLALQMDEEASCGGEQSMLLGNRYYSTNDYVEIHRNGGVRCRSARVMDIGL